MNATRAVASSLIVFVATLPAAAAPLDVILEVALTPPGNLGDTVFNVVGLYGSNFFGTIEEQYPTSLQAKLSGHLRVRFDPQDPQTIQFVGGGSHLTLSTGDRVHLLSVTEDSLAYPGGTPANLAGVSGSNNSTKAALRNTSFEFVSTPINLLQPDPLSPSLFIFDPQAIAGSVISGQFHAENVPLIGSGSFPMAGASLNNNLWPTSGVFNWGPVLDPSINEVTGGFEFQYQYQPFGSLFSLNLSGNVQMAGVFSSDNYADITTEGEVVEVLGGANTAGGVTAIANGLIAEGTFVGQQIGPNGLPRGALEKALSVPDLAYSLGLVDYTTPIWNLDFTGAAAGIEITFGFTEYTTPNWSESQLVLYHFNSQGEWERVAGQVLDTQANTIRFTALEFSPFMLAVVPEPGGVVYALLGLVGLAGAAVRRCNLRSTSVV